MISKNKCYLIAWILQLVFCLNSSGQIGNYRTDIDTLESFENKVLVHYKIFVNEGLIEESTSFLYPVIHKIPRFKLTGNLIQTNIELDSIIRHGTTKKYFENKLIRVTEFINGEEISSIYYNLQGIEISKQDFFNMYHLPEPCRIMNSEYFIKGQREKKRNPPLSVVCNHKCSKP